ncbi:MAG: type IV secretory system conjugative DNA transfer family protein [Acidimicrobiales bacterium]
MADQRVVVGSDGRGLVTAGPEQSVLVLGPPRSGKTSSLVVPNVLVAWGPVVSTSTKPDVMAATLAGRARRGRCWLYDPSGTVARPEGVSPLRWSPVGSATTWDGALLVARALVGSAPSAMGMTDADHWTERAEALLAPLLHAGARGGDDLVTVLGWVNRRDGRPALERLRDGASTASDLLAGLLATESRELSGIWSTASGAVAAYRSDAAVATATDPNFDPRRFVAGTDTVYICASGRHQDLVAPLVVGLVEDIRGAAFERAAARVSTGAGASTGGPRAQLPAGVWPTVEAPVLLALDEVSNVAPLPGLPSLISEGGGQGVLTLACLQDLSQARRRWGVQADGFGSLFGATVVLPGIGDVRTLDALSVLCGTHDIWVRSESRSPAPPWGRRRSRTWSTRRERRLEADQISVGRPGAGLLLGGGRLPAWTPLTPWWAMDRAPVGRTPRDGTAAQRVPAHSRRPFGRGD